MDLLELDDPLFRRKLCNHLRCFNDRDVEANSQSEDLYAGHLPKVAPLLLLIHTYHHSQLSLVQSYQPPPSVHQ